MSEQNPEINSGRASDPRWWGDPMQSFQNGVQLDLRAKLAVDFLKAGILAHPDRWCAVLEATDSSFAVLPQRMARFALALASAVLSESQAQGLVKDMPEHGELTRAQRLQIERSVRVNIEQQLAGQRIVREEGISGPQIQTAPQLRL